MVPSGGLRGGSRALLANVLPSALTGAKVLQFDPHACRTVRSQVVDLPATRLAVAVRLAIPPSLNPGPIDGHPVWTHHLLIPPVATHEDARTVCAVSCRRYDGVH